MANEPTARYVYLTTPRTLSNGQDVRPSLDSAGNQVVSIAPAGGSPGGTTAATPYQAAKVVAATGTPEAISATTLLVDSVVIYGQKAKGSNNTSTCYLGFTSVNEAQLLPITAGSYVSLSAPLGKKIDLAGIFVDVGTAGDGVIYTAFA